MKASRVFRWLTALYPRTFREEHGSEMMLWFEQGLRERSKKGFLAALGYWSFLVRDVLRSAPREHLSILRSSRSSPARERRHGFVDVLRQDLMSAVRSYSKTPGIFIVLVGTMALAIGFVTTLFSVLDGVLLRPLPYQRAERLVRVGAGMTEESGRLYALALPEAFHLGEQSRSFESMAVTRGARVTLWDQGGEPELQGAALVSSSFFELLGVQPALGRFFLPEDDEPGAEAVAVLDHGLWLDRFGGDAEILGSTVRLGSASLTVIGILPSGFHPPEALVPRDTGVWLSISHFDDEMRNDPINHFLGGIARLRDGVTLDQAQSELASLDQTYVERWGRTEPSHFGVAALRAETVGGTSGALLPLLVAVGLLLAIACANIATLLLIRAGARTRAMALRGAVGATRGRLVRQLLTESVLLGLVGGAMGAGLCFGGVELFKVFSPPDIPRLAEVGVDIKVLAFAFATSFLASVFFGLAPALRLAQTDLGQVLKAGSRTTLDRRRASLKGAFVVAEVALAFVLVTAAGLMLHSFWRLHQVDLGFETRHAHVLGATGPGESGEETAAFYRRLMARLGALPGVTHVGATSNLPMSGRYAMRNIGQVEGRTLPTTGRGFDEEGYSVYFQYVTPGFFEALGVAQLRGRGFQDSDGADSRPVAVLNEAAARDLFGDDDAIGRRFLAGDGYQETWFEVVGVVGNSRQHELEREAGPELYLSFAQAASSWDLDVVVRTSGPVPGILQALRRESRRLSPERPIRYAVHLEDFVADSAATPRFYALVLGSFAGVALLLALVGIHGVLGVAVAERTHEIGVRIALGAEASTVLGLVVESGARLVAMGLALGLAGALATTHVLESLMFGITVRDLPTFALSVIAVAVLALLISLLPARRATKVDPLHVLNGG